MALPRAGVLALLLLAPGCRSGSTSEPTAAPTVRSAQTVAAAPAPVSPAAPAAEAGARAVRPDPPFSGDAAFAVLGRLVQMQRFYAAPKRGEALAFLRAELGPVTDKLEQQEVAVTEPKSGVKYTLTNLVARQNPQAQRRILLASHWDSRLWAEEDADPSTRGTPGEYANDSGSGVALLLELAKRTRSMKNLGIDYVMFDGEEFGRPGSDDYCQGSKAFARAMKDGAAIASPKPREAIVLDMVGDKDLDIYFEVTSLMRAPELTREIWSDAKDLGYEAFRPSPKYQIIDDHTPLQELGVRAVLLIDYDYPYWHTHGDTLDKVSPKSLGMVGDVLLRVVSDRDAKLAP